MAKYIVGNVLYCEDHNLYRVVKKHGCSSCDLSRNNLCDANNKVHTLKYGSIHCLELIGDNHCCICFEKVKSKNDVLELWRNYGK